MLEVLVLENKSGLNFRIDTFLVKYHLPIILKDQRLDALIVIETLFATFNCYF